MGSVLRRSLATVKSYFVTVCRKKSVRAGIRGRVRAFFLELAVSLLAVLTVRTRGQTDNM